MARQLLAAHADEVGFRAEFLGDVIRLLGGFHDGEGRIHPRLIHGNKPSRRVFMRAVA